MKVYLWESQGEDGQRVLLGAFSTLARALEVAGGSSKAPLDGPRVSAEMGQHYWGRDLRPWRVDGRGLSFIVTEVSVEQ